MSFPKPKDQACVEDLSRILMLSSTLSCVHIIAAERPNSAGAANRQYTQLSQMKACGFALRCNELLGGVRHRFIARIFRAA